MELGWWNVSLVEGMLSCRLRRWKGVYEMRVTRQPYQMDVLYMVVGDVVLQV